MLSFKIFYLITRDIIDRRLVYNRWITLVNCVQYDNFLNNRDNFNYVNMSYWSMSSQQSWGFVVQTTWFMALTFTWSEYSPRLKWAVTESHLKNIVHNLMTVFYSCKEFLTKLTCAQDSSLPIRTDCDFDLIPQADQESLM